ncbi:MAG: WecB/TagA/CpsF family glycosyltransferase, partial [bacterium]|nr:WecB/TagA/CpsF family glycosyltransferase [bacterium]
VRLIYGARLNNLNGTDFNLYLIDSFDKLGFKIALYGAKKDSIAITYKKLVDKYKNIYYFQDGYSDLNINNLNDKTVLFIGLGTPKQEIWLFDNLDKIISKNIIAITVGGFFDYVSGYQHRAPRIIRKLNLEWMFRLITDPKRNFKKTLRNFMFLPYLIIDFLELNFITKK